MPNKQLAQAIRGAVEPKSDQQNPINITIKLDMSSLAESIKQAPDEYQKVKGLSPSVS